MEDNTTTGEPVQDAGAQEALPTQDTSQPAEQPTDESSVNESSQGAESALPEVDEELQKYAKSHGLELDSPNAIKAAKMAKENQAQFQRTRQKASELEKTMVQDTQTQAAAAGISDDERIAIREIATRQVVRDFWDEHPEAKDYEKQMIEVLGDNPHLAGDLEGLYAKALLKSNALENSKAQGGREALTELANKQRAAAPSGSAVTSSPSTPQKITRAVMQQKLQAGDSKWFTENSALINQMVAEGTLQ